MQYASSRSLSYLTLVLVPPEPAVDAAVAAQLAGYTGRVLAIVLRIVTGCVCVREGNRNRKLNERNKAAGYHNLPPPARAQMHLLSPAAFSLNAVKRMEKVELMAAASAKKRMCRTFERDTTESAMEPQKFFSL